VPATATALGDPAVVFGGVLPVAALGVVGAEPVRAAGGIALVSDSIFEGVDPSPPQPVPSQSRALNTSNLRARVIMASTPVVPIFGPLRAENDGRADRRLTLKCSPFTIRQDSVCVRAGSS
jgi:hypothetical protein